MFTLIAFIIEDRLNHPKHKLAKKLIKVLTQNSSEESKILFHDETFSVFDRFSIKASPELYEVEIFLG